MVSQRKALFLGKRVYTQKLSSVVTSNRFSHESLQAQKAAEKSVKKSICKPFNLRHVVAYPSTYSSRLVWSSGMTSLSHREDPGFDPQHEHAFCFAPGSSPRPRRVRRVLSQFLFCGTVQLVSKSYEYPSGWAACHLAEGLPWTYSAAKQYEFCARIRSASFEGLYWH